MKKKSVYSLYLLIPFILFILIAPFGCSSDAGLYHNSDEINKELHKLAEDYPEIARVSSLGKSIQGRNLWAIKISDNVDQYEGEAVVALVGGHHAREWISVDVPFLIAEHLIKNYSVDTDIKQLVDNSVIWIVPLMNPDGHQYSVILPSERFWRKNRRHNGHGIYGVDLNRNYALGWGGPGSSGDPSSIFYRGTEPFSEPETIAIRDFLQNKLPAAFISYHSFGEVIKYPWGHTIDPAPDQELMESLASSMADKIRNVVGKKYITLQASDYMDFNGDRIVSGTAVDWYYALSSAPSFTIELRPDSYIPWVTWMLPESQIDPTFRENLSAALFLIDWAIQENSLAMTNSFGMVFNAIPEGSFTMGSPADEPGRGLGETQHEVILTESFNLQTTEVTQAQWEAVLTQAEAVGINTGGLVKTPSYISDCSNCPVEQVSWDDIQTFISVLNQLGEGTYTLPTEAQWEYAARAGSETAFANGGIVETECGEDPNLNVMGWYCYNAGFTTHSVTDKAPNKWRLYGIHGNVYEWCLDWFDGYPAGPVTDPEGPSSGEFRVARGGSYDDTASYSRSANRNGWPPNTRRYEIGFRMLRVE